MSTYLTQAQLLMQRERYDEATAILQRALAEDPDDGMAHAFFGLCLMQRGQPRDAKKALLEAIRQLPDEYFPHYVLGSLYLDQDQLIDARRAADEAIRLAPGLADPYALRARVEIAAEHWTESLRWVERGLSCEPEHTGLSNLRVIVLTQLGRRDEANEAARNSLAADPNDPTSHANQGWQLLHANDPKAALAHFKEALRLEPGHEWAKAGLVEALKARNPLYRLMLAYFLWMAKLDSRVQFWLILGAWFVVRALRAVGEQSPEFKPVASVVVALYVGFVVLTWTAVPMFNLLLRLNPHGWNALSPRDRQATNAFGGCLLVGMVLAGVAVVTGNGFVWAWAGLAGIMAVVSSTALMQTENDRRRLMLILGLILLPAGSAAIMGAMYDQRTLVTISGLVFFLSLIVFMFSPIVQIRRKTT